MAKLPRTTPFSRCPVCQAVLAAPDLLTPSAATAACPNGPHDVTDRTPPPSYSRKLLHPEPAPPPDEGWPEWLMEGLDTSQRALLQGASPAPATPAKPGRDEVTRSLLDQGLVLEDDGHGIRLTGRPVRGRGTSTGHLRPSEIVRLAAELDDGRLPEDLRYPCPKCQAVIARDSRHCTWCGADLAPT